MQKKERRRIRQQDKRNSSPLPSGKAGQKKSFGSTGVILDEDSMENINMYWEKANQELKQMADQTFEDISGAATPDRPCEERENLKLSSHLESVINAKPEPKKHEDSTRIPQSASSPATRIIRGTIQNLSRSSETPSYIGPCRSFDEEFEAPVNNVQLLGFSDSSDSLGAQKDKPGKKKAKRAKPSISPDTRQMRSPCSTVDVTQAQSNAVDTGKTKYNILGVTDTHAVQNGTLISMFGSEISKITVGGKKRQSISPAIIHYILSGTAVVEDFRDPNGKKSSCPKHKYRYDREPCSGYILRHSAAFYCSKGSSYVYNPEARIPLVMLALKPQSQTYLAN